MSRVQVLDTGDRVKTRAEGNYTYNREGVVFKLNPHFKDYLVAFKDGRTVFVDMAWSREDLSRIGGDLQVGDFVVVYAETPSLRLSGDKGIIVDDYEDGNFSVYLFGHLNTLPFSPDHLTRIRKAEALA